MAFFSKKIFSIRSKKEVPGGLWIKCPDCSEMLFRQELESCLWVCPHCDHHFRLNRQDRINLLANEGSFEEWDAELHSVDKLKFTGAASYTTKLKENEAKTGYKDAVSCGRAQLNHHTIALGVMDFNFLGASMGSVVGEKITRLIERGTEERIPVIVSCASGGARMYEGLYSLMQMAKTSGALARHAEAGLPYIPLLTHPTTAGVMASFATLGDLIVAEPKALIGFAGPRVIKETTQQDLPDGFQRSEFLKDRGLIDKVIHRREVKQTLSTALDYLCPVGGTPASAPAEEGVAPAEEVKDEAPKGE